MKENCISQQQYLPTSRIRIFMADDHKILLDSFAFSLKAVPDFQLVGCSTDGVEMLNQIGLASPCIEVLILDLRMPHINGIETIRKIKEISPRTKILILTGFPNSDEARQAINNGVSGFIDKIYGTTKIIVAIRKIIRGETFIEISPNENDKTELIPHPKLTRRQIEVLCLAIKGLNGREIAEKLHIAQSVVEYHLANLRVIFYADNKAALVRKALDMGFCEGCRTRGICSSEHKQQKLANTLLNIHYNPILH